MARNELADRQELARLLLDEYLVEPADRATLVRKLGKPRTTIYDALFILYKGGEIVNEKVYGPKGMPGRPMILFKKVQHNGSS